MAQPRHQHPREPREPTLVSGMLARRGAAVKRRNRTHRTPGGFGEQGKRIRLLLFMVGG